MWTRPHLVVNRTVAKTASQIQSQTAPKLGIGSKLSMPVVLGLCYTLKITPGAWKNPYSQATLTPIKSESLGVGHRNQHSSENSDLCKLKACVNALIGRKTCCSNFIPHVSFKNISYIQVSFFFLFI